MMTKPIIKIHNIESDEVIERQMDDAEFNVYEQNRINEELRLEELAEKAKARAGLLNKLGITEEEAKLLLS